MLNYYHRHFQSFSDVLEPLHYLLRKGLKCKQTDKQKILFEKTKNILDGKKLLVHYYPGKFLILACDTSPYGLGAVLSHQMQDGREKPVTFASSTLPKAERNYSQIEKQTLAVVYAVKIFHQYLFGRHFCLYFDHKPLLGLFSETKGISFMAVARIQ